jgi:predicted nucleotide-binding protein
MSMTPNPRSVFVIHGRDEEARRALWGFLRALDLLPRDWEEIVRSTGGTAPFLGDVVAEAFRGIQAAVVLLTPDDAASLHPNLHDAHEPDYETKPTGQARPNVLFEAGMALALHPNRTVIIEIGHLRPFSDLGGRNVIRFDGTPKALQKIAQRLITAECAVNTGGTDWLDASRFTGLDAYTRRP